MVWRTPSSLKWLIDKRARLDGRLRKVAQEIAALTARKEQLEERADRLRMELDAVDRTMALHAIRIEPQGIVPIRHERRRTFPHGGMSRFILATLREQNGWLTTKAIATLARQKLESTQGAIDANYLRIMIRGRLRILATFGKVERRLATDTAPHHDGKAEAYWRLAKRPQSE